MKRLIQSILLLGLAAMLLSPVSPPVAVAQDGEEAVAIYRKCFDEGRRFDVVIMDLTVPGGIGGKEALQLLKEVDPSAKAIVSSGYSNDPVMGDYKAHGFAGCVTKPYGVKQLSSVLTKVMSAKSKPNR